MEPPRVPKGTQNHQKSPRAPLGKPSERPSRHDPEKSGSWAPPGTLPYGSRTVTAMVFTHSIERLRTTFLVALGLILAPFWAPRAPKNRPGSEKGPFRKYIKKRPRARPRKCFKMTPKSLQIQTMLGSLGLLRGPPGPKRGPNAKIDLKMDKKQQKIVENRSENEANCNVKGTRRRHVLFFLCRL